jgi:predicted GNAT family acetyltransferase
MMETPPILHHRVDHKGAFVMEREGKRLAEMTYTMAGSRAIIDHTTVDDALRGTGAGKKLVEAAVQWARAGKVKILPLCPFAKSVFDKTPAYADALAD